jgi:Fungal trichothecene efflux pump (TRI12)
MATFKSNADAEAVPVPPSPATATSQHAVNLEELPTGYYRSKNFIGSLAGVCLMAISLYLGFSLPVNSLTAINADLGPYPSYSMITTMFTLISGVCNVYLEETALTSDIRPY